MFKAKHSISLLFNANKVYDRQVIEGIGHYLQSSKVDWDVYLEEDFLARIDNINDWVGDGIIADFDAPTIQKAVEGINIPIIGVGGSYENENDYPNVPYVATDNLAVVKCAYEHLKQKGLERFAFYGFPPDDNHRWATEREKAVVKLCKEDGFDCAIYRGHPTRPETWQYSMNRLSDWLQSLPNPVGVISVTDARARHLLQACDHTGKLVPDQISIVGIDDDDIARNLSRISLSSVTQGCFEMGFQAAKLLHRRLDNPNLKNKIVMVPPVGVAQRQSTDFKALKDPHVIQAMHFIRQNACRGIKVDQVLDYVGISRSNLETRFYEERGHSIHNEIHNEKLEKACSMLKSGENQTSEIAAMCGYPSLQYMYAVFRKHFDQTPKEYREQHAQQSAI
ncbi:MULTISPECIES: XylR family transcriptional regulator [Aliiglaciecola]|uniref:XylR family transcriptional regulator n=1 Tax=Aliiglaciecola TaxID=1406885 RepID=UPI001C084772|nr:MULTISPECIES: DNA-binding transcriptional regulator [Aliiglaciecola]MBU2876575.1 DNA-binding transcriptional regulator [Aliiglaciecola lipolytica]MDO6711490.1 DNA-binding transcriptional regulator [Aliiglaciecola sp. 2_MG-2023]MDO6752533.1 DNA-binding transcriptional regulator [Aliiglaciecola sp. 1_MG-2023]